MTDPRDMTTGEAEAWRAGWQSAARVAVAVASATPPAGMTLSEWMQWRMDVSRAALEAGKP